MKIVEIEWVEHYSTDGTGWTTQTELELATAEVHKPLKTVGYLLGEHATHWILTDTVAPDGEFGRIWSIAKGVSKMRVLSK